MKTISQLFRALAVVALSAMAFACAGNSSMTASPEKVSFTKAALYPEGVDWDAANNRFLVTSIHQGLIGAVTVDGHYSVFASDPHMVSAVGLHIDAPRDRVLVCNADPGASEHSSPKTTGKLAGLAVFRLSTGELIRYVDLAKGLDGAHFCNDLVIDKDGSAYVSDSFSTVIYKVDPSYHASVLINDKRFSGVGFNLNGLVIKDHYLLVNKYNDGTLFKVPLNNPEAFTQVKISEKFHGADGMLWARDGSLVLIANDSGHGGSKPAIKTDKVVRLRSTDNWASATVISEKNTGDVFATTGTLKDGQVYVVHAMLHVLFNPKTVKQTEQFDIRRY